MKLRLLADHPVLNFINTIDPREGPHRVEYLSGFADLVDWARHGGILTGRNARKIAVEGKCNSRVATRAFKRAIELREALYTIFVNVAARRPPSSDAMAQLVTAHRDAQAHGAFVRTGDRFQWVLPATPDFVHWRIAEDAIELLQSTKLNRVKRCPGSGDCGWLFFDTSKNATRRWCSMEGCGNRAKLRRFLRRQKKGPRQPQRGLQPTRLPLRQQPLHINPIHPVNPVSFRGR